MGNKNSILERVSMQSRSGSVLQPNLSLNPSMVDDDGALITNTKSSIEELEDDDLNP